MFELFKGTRLIQNVQRPTRSNWNLEDCLSVLDEMISVAGGLTTDQKKHLRGLKNVPAKKKVRSEGFSALDLNDICSPLSPSLTFTANLLCNITTKQH